MARLLHADAKALESYCRDPDSYEAAHPQGYIQEHIGDDHFDPLYFLATLMNNNNSVFVLFRNSTVEDFVTSASRMPLARAAGIDPTPALALLPDGLAAFEKIQEILLEAGLDFFGICQDGYEYAVIRAEDWKPLDTLLMELNSGAITIYDPGLFLLAWPWMAEEEPRFFNKGPQPNSESRPSQT